MAPKTWLRVRDGRVCGTDLASAARAQGSEYSASRLLVGARRNARGELRPHLPPRYDDPAAHRRDRLELVRPRVQTAARDDLTGATTMTTEASAKPDPVDVAAEEAMRILNVAPLFENKSTADKIFAQIARCDAFVEREKPADADTTFTEMALELSRELIHFATNV